MNAPQAGGTRRSTQRLPPTDAMGLALHVRHAAPLAGARGSVVLVHGATLASGLWDVAVPGYSLLESLAAAGYSVWAPDLRGYARSQRLAQPGAAYGALADAVADIGAVVEHACGHDGVDRVLLAGGSWGTLTTASYAIRQPARVAALALMAPLFASVNELWLADLADPACQARLNPAIGATRTVREPDLLRRWDPEIPWSDKEDRRDPAVLRALMRDALAAEPGGADHFTVPNGTLHDLFEVFSGRALYDPAELRLPVLLVRGEDDATSTDGDARALFGRLGTRDKVLMTVGDAGHFLCVERRAGVFQRALADFADRTLAPGPR